MDERYDFTDNDDTEPEESDDENRPVPEFIMYDGVRYELASQDLEDRDDADEKAASLSENGYYKTKVIHIQGSWRVYAHRVGFRK